MSLDSIANVTISADTVGAQAAGFGIPLLLSYNAAWLERTRNYSNLLEVASDFATTTAEYKAAAKLFGSDTKPSKIIIGRCALKPTQQFDITVLSVANSTAYKVRVGATTYTVTSDSSATNDEIVNAFVTAINADTHNLTASATGSVGSKVLSLIADSAGLWEAVEIFDFNQLSIAQTHADPGAATDLAAIALEDNSWYFILNTHNSKAHALEIAGYAESNNKLFVGASNDSNNATLAIGSDTTTSLMGQAKTSARARTALIYSPKVDDFADCAWVGRCAPLTPGSETWKFKTLAGVSAVSMTTSQKTNVSNKKGNTYTLVASKNITEEGVTSSGEFIDVIRTRDKLVSDIQTNVFNALTNADKIPFTDDGVSVIQGAVMAALRQGVKDGALSASPAPKCTAPLVADVTTDDKAARLLRNVKFECTLAGAIHLTTIFGVVSV